MYFWKIDLLKQQLIKQGLSEKQLFYYILINMTASAFFIEFAMYFPEESPNAWSYIQSLIYIAITAIGTYMAFRANGGESGVQFAARYFSIGLVVTLRFLVLLIPLMIILIFYFATYYDADNELSTSGAEVLLTSIWYGWLYANITKHIRQVASTTS